MSIITTIIIIIMNRKGFQKKKTVGFQDQQSQPAGWRTNILNDVNLLQLVHGCFPRFKPFSCFVCVQVG